MNKQRELCAILACKNGGFWLYGKPLQNISIKNHLRIIDYIILNLKQFRKIDEIILAIADTLNIRVYEEVVCDWQ